MEIFKNVRRQVSNQLDQMKLNREIDQLVQAVKENPNNIEALRRLGEAYQEIGNAEAAVSHYVKLAELYRTTRQTELALAFYRKIERMVDSSQRATILKQMVAVYFDTRQFDKAYEYSRQVISLYLNENQSEAATGFLKMLPGFGERDADYRKELREMIQERNDRWMQGAKATWVGADGGFQTSPRPDDFSDRVVLLVDDEPHVLMILEKIIKPLGCQILMANNGLEALEIAQQTPPALVISDLMMPKMDGSQLFAALQKDPNLSRVPFVCLSSRAQEDEKVSAFEQGVEDYWGKPFSVKEIPLRVKRILRRTPPLTRISGQLSHTSVTDLLNQMERERKDGVLKIVTPQQQTGEIYFHGGMAVDAECATSAGLAAIIRMINWTEGSYAFNQQTVSRENVIRMRASDLILEALHRYDEEQALLAMMPARHITATLPNGFNVSWFAGAATEQVRRILTLVDGRRTIGECIDECQGDTELTRMLASLWSPEVRQATLDATPSSLAALTGAPPSAPPPSSYAPPFVGVAPPGYAPPPPYANYPATSYPGGYPPSAPSYGAPGGAPPMQTTLYASPFESAPPSFSGYAPPPAATGHDFRANGDYHMTFRDPSNEEHLARQLYDAVIAAKRQCKEPLDDFTFARFHRILCEQATKIKTQLNCAYIAFSVGVESGRVKFIAKGL
jgi:DNA-binding response OmpR family regulator